MTNLEIKESPDPNKYPIIPPDMDYIYFENSEELPFEPLNTELSLPNLWWLAECAFLVYNHPGFARMAYKLAGFDSFKFFQGTGTECMVVQKKDFVIISFRGTELRSFSAIHEIRTDLNTIPVDFDMGGKVHRGFYSALREIWDGKDGLESYIGGILSENSTIPIWITGHSLGGALAGLCFTKVPEARGLVMFGSPRIGDPDFIELTKGRSIWRVEHKKDPIVLVPPNIPALKFFFDDMGTLVYIGENDEVSDKRPELTSSEHLELVKSTISDQKKRRKSLTHPLELNDYVKSSIQEWKEYKKIFTDDSRLNITDHMPIFYTTTLWNILVSTLP